ncbi:hypothetical protein [Cryptosporangium minutisporangium]|uniref:Uncharacterized protein n=1 Tax=Cryptosporangium minutisporangium TaxID=113569 RepID=A0ABP6TB53_9ACTN
MRVPRYVWPAALCATLFLGYAAGKAYYATQGRLGLPGGATVPPEAYEQLGYVPQRQWALAALGLVAALLAVATVVPRDGAVARWLPPRWLILTGLWGALVPLAAGVPFVVFRLATDGWSAVGSALQSAVLAGLWLTMVLSYQRRTRELR